MDQGAEARPARATALAIAVQAVGGGLGWSVLPPLMPDAARELSLSEGTIGLVWGAASLGIALASPLGGALVDRHGPRRVASIALFIGAIACAARAWATGPVSLGLTMLLFGAHVGCVAPAIPKLLAGHVPLARLGRANGLALLGYTLGTALTVLVARTMLAPALGGWRATMLFAAAAMSVVAVVFATLARDRGASAPHASLGGSVALLADRGLARVAVMHFCLFGGYLAMLGMLPRALLSFGVPVTSVGPVVAAWLLAAGIANVAGPSISDRLARRRPVLIIGSLVAAGALAAFALVPSHPWWLLAVAALGGGSCAPLLFTLPLELPAIGAARAGAALGALSLVGQIGGFLLPVVVGQLAGADGDYPLAFGALAVVHLLIAPVALGLPERDAASAAAQHASPAIAR